jgi:hypothetical protein
LTEQERYPWERTENNSSHTSENQNKDIGKGKMPVEPERQKRRERTIDSTDDAIPIKISAAAPLAECNIGDDNKAADRGKKLVSCI